MLGKLQRGLESLYRIEPTPQVEQFVIGAAERDAAGVSRSPKEQLLLQEDEDGLAIGLFVDPELLDGMQEDEHLHAQLLHGPKFESVMMLLEGVSHFVYVAHKADREHQVSALELELQAEVDKYVTALLTRGHSQEQSQELRRRLFVDIEYLDDLDSEEQDRYRVANENALRYSTSLERRFVGPQKITEMLRELRHFYRMSLPAKMQLIQRAA